ncbi:MAG: histidine phosphatase family protein [Jatrophihabitantaceae bacterium]
MRFVIVRHGQSENNRLLQETGGLRGRAIDPLLTDLGHRQSRLLGEAIQDWPAQWRPSCLYTSLMARAVQTAATLAAVTGVPVVGHPALAECGGPFVEGSDRTRRTHLGAPRAELLALCEGLELPAECDDEGWWRRGYESEEASRQARAEEFLSVVRDRRPPEAVVVLVTHEGFLQQLLRSLLGIPTMAGWFGSYNTGVCRLWDEEAAHLAGTTTADCVNSTAHLPADLVTD